MCILYLQEPKKKWKPKEKLSANFNLIQPPLVRKKSKRGKAKHNWETHKKKQKSWKHSVAQKRFAVCVLYVAHKENRFSTSNVLLYVHVKKRGEKWQTLDRVVDEDGLYLCMWKILKSQRALGIAEKKG